MDAQKGWMIEGEEIVLERRFQQLVQLRTHCEILAGPEEEIGALFLQALAEDPELKAFWDQICSARPQWIPSSWLD
jgi:hypothetical protein